MANPAEQQEATGFRLSPQQELLLLGDPGISTQCAVALDDADPARLRAALSELTATFEILRTALVRRPGMRLPTQVIMENVEPSFEVDDRPVQVVAEAEAAQPFDIAHAPLLRTRVARLADGRPALLLTAHPAVADGPSLLQLAKALRDGEVAAEEPLQYADYAEWRAEVAGEAALDESHVPAPALLFGNLPAAETSPVVRARTVEVSAESAEAAGAAAAEANVSRSLFVEACWHACVQRLSGARAVTMTGVTDGRSHDELAGAVGAFAQVVEITSRIEPETTVAEVVDQVRRAREAGVRGEDALTGVALERIASRNTVSFQAIDSSLPSADLHLLRAAAARVPLQLTWIETADLPRAELTYDTVAYEEADVEAIASAFSTLLAAASTAARVEQLPIVPDDRRAELVALLRGPAIELARESYHRLFEQQVERTPERMAARDEQGSLTYAALNARANAVAARLRELGVGRGDAVGMCAHRSTESIVAVLGILKAGGAYVPLNFDHPAARLLHQLQETGARAVVAEADLVERLPSFDGPILTLETSEVGDVPNPDHVNDADDLVYVMYTSGSTGLPKGVEVTHANLVDYSLGLVERLGLNGGDALDFAVVSAISTDLGNTSIFPALLTGGCVNLVAPETAMDPEAFAAVAQEWSVDVLKITPSHLGALLSGTDSAAVLPGRLLVLGGEALPWELVRDIHSRAPELEIVNHYGPTETTVGSCAFDIGTPVDAWRPRTVPIGRPLPNAVAYVVDETGELVPPGVAGELLLGGAGVARGYAARDEETAERFVPDPFGEGRVYRTGDRARLLPDGSIEFLGRFDDQLKIRGYRVEPGEVEAALARHPAVTQAAVRAVEDGGNARLVAYAVTRSAVSAEELHAFLAESLPEYMIPSAFVSLEAMPLTASGKVDRLALPDPEAIDADRQARYVAPRNDVEAEIARIWSELLGVDQVGVNDDFFELGGHSLLATQVIMRVRRVYGDVPLQAMFMTPTPAGLAEVIQAGAEPAEAAS